MPFVRVVLTAMSVSWLAVTVLLTAMGVFLTAMSVSMTAAVRMSVTAE